MTHSQQIGCSLIEDKVHFSELFLDHTYKSARTHPTRRLKNLSASLHPGSGRSLDAAQVCRRPEGRIPLSCWECAITLPTVQCSKYQSDKVPPKYQLCTNRKVPKCWRVQSSNHSLSCWECTSTALPVATIPWLHLVYTYRRRALKRQLVNYLIQQCCFKKRVCFLGIWGMPCCQYW